MRQVRIKELWGHRLSGKRPGRKSLSVRKGRVSRGKKQSPLGEIKFFAAAMERTGKSFLSEGRREPEKHRPRRKKTTRKKRKGKNHSSSKDGSRELKNSSLPTERGRECTRPRKTTILFNSSVTQNSEAEPIFLKYEGRRENSSKQTACKLKNRVDWAPNREEKRRKKRHLQGLLIMRMGGKVRVRLARESVGKIRPKPIITRGAHRPVLLKIGRGTLPPLRVGSTISQKKKSRGY